MDRARCSITPGTNRRTKKVMNVPTTEETIDKMLRAFDFQKVQIAMLSMAWKWSALERTPNVEELKSEARRLLIEVATEQPEAFQLSVQTGGFVASRLCCGILALSFEIGSIKSDEV